MYFQLLPLKVILTTLNIESVFSVPSSLFIANKSPTLNFVVGCTGWLAACTALSQAFLVPLLAFATNS